MMMDRILELIAAQSLEMQGCSSKQVNVAPKNRFNLQLEA